MQRKYSLWTFFLAFFSFLLLCSCKNTENSTSVVLPSSLSYQVNEPTVIFKLPKELKEISGITVFKNKCLVAIQDEKGVLYQLNKKTGNLEKTINFSADGDYEGITAVGDLLYVLRADGVLFEISNWQKEKRINTKVIDTNLGEINDTEGLAYDADSNDLLIVCKGSAKIGEKKNKARAGYRYDLDNKEFFVKPSFSISRKDFKHFVKDSLKGSENYNRFRKKLKQSKKDMPLQPSAVAIHPFTKDIYILAAVGNALLVLDRHKNIKACQYLSPELFEQPEGLAFDRYGNMFIASESKKHKAVVFKFDYLQ